MKSSGLKSCPECARHIHAADTQCTHCGASIGALDPSDTPQSASGKLMRLGMVAGMAASMGCFACVYGSPVTDGETGDAENESTASSGSTQDAQETGLASGETSSSQGSGDSSDASAGSESESETPEGSGESSQSATGSSAS